MLPCGLDSQRRSLLTSGRELCEGDKYKRTSTGHESGVSPLVPITYQKSGWDSKLSFHTPVCLMTFLLLSSVGCGRRVWSHLPCYNSDLVLQIQHLRTRQEPDCTNVSGRGQFLKKKAAALLFPFEVTDGRTGLYCWSRLRDTPSQGILAANPRIPLTDWVIALN